MRSGFANSSCAQPPPFWRKYAHDYIDAFLIHDQLQELIFFQIDEEIVCLTG